MRQKICRCHRPASQCQCPSNWANCRECGSSITWVKTPRNKRMPINGHLRTEWYDSKTQLSHFATCPARRKPSQGKPKKQKPQSQQLNLFAEHAIGQLKELKAKQQGGAR